MHEYFFNKKHMYTYILKEKKFKMLKKTYYIGIRVYIVMIYLWFIFLSDLLSNIIFFTLNYHYLYT